MKKINFKLNNFGKDRAFTLVETLVAISILMIAVAGPLTLAQRSLSSAFISKDQVIASYLAEDTLDRLRMVANLNKNSNDWFSGITAEESDTDINSAKLFEILDANVLQELDAGDGKLYYCENKRKYVSYDEGSTGSDCTESKFRRYFTAIETDEANQDELSINVHIEWKTGSIMQQLQVREFFYKIF